MTQIVSRPVSQKARRILDGPHLVFLHILPCVVTGREGEGVQAHHLLRIPTNERGGARKSGDNWAIPLWHETHHDLHHCGMDERDFLRQYGIYGPGIAALLYQLSGDEMACRRAILEARNG